MSERTAQWIIANAINEQARGDPEAQWQTTAGAKAQDRWERKTCAH
jgi:hypothetical protein